MRGNNWRQEMITGKKIFSAYSGEFISVGIMLAIFIFAYQLFVGLSQISWRFTLFFLIVWTLIISPFYVVLRETKTWKEWMRKQLEE